MALGSVWPIYMRFNYNYSEGEEAASVFRIRNLASQQMLKQLLWLFGWIVPRVGYV